MNKNFIITSYNIHKGMSALNRHVIMPKLAKALQDINSDIFCLQEVQGQHLKRAIKYNEYPDQSHHEWFGGFLQFEHSYGKNAQYQHGHHGNAILSRFSLDPKHNVNISVNRLEKRGILHCEVSPDDWQTSIVVLCVHLNLLEKDRQKQYQAIIDYVNQSIDKHQPLILAGDFNDWRKRSCQNIAQTLNMQEACLSYQQKLLPTFPAKFPLLSLDRIYVRNLRVVRSWVHQGKPWTQMSDHLPISAQLAYVD